ncbi:hypothetical protein Droror1_Dr00007315 [Drosera rotundifolia]
MAVSNNIIAVLNFISLLCSIPILAAGIWFASKPDAACIHLFRYPILILGFLLLLVSLLGFVGAYWYKEGLLGIYLCFMAVLIVVLVVVLVFAFVVTRPDGGYTVGGRGYEEYRLAGFSGWLREKVTGSENWGRIRVCLQESGVCGKLDEEFVSASDFFMAHLSPIQSGCCKPPTACGYQYVNPTMWINPTNPTADPDCTLWSSDQSQLCYSCSSCKAGLLGNLRLEWRKANLVLIATVVVLICVYVIACSAFRNAQTEDLFRRYKRGWA